MDSPCVEFDGWRGSGFQYEIQQQVRLESDEDDDRADFGATAAGRN